MDDDRDGAVVVVEDDVGPFGPQELAGFVQDRGRDVVARERTTDDARELLQQFEAAVAVVQRRVRPVRDEQRRSRSR